MTIIFMETSMLDKSLTGYLKSPPCKLQLTHSLLNKVCPQYLQSCQYTDRLNTKHFSCIFTFHNVSRSIYHNYVSRKQINKHRHTEIKLQKQVKITIGPADK